jgi:hypothetical protein
MGFAGRLREYGRAVSSVAAWALIALIWFYLFQSFLANMLPRLHHLSAVGMRIADRPCGSPGCDFSVFWPAGFLARLGEVRGIYDPAAFLALRQALFMPHVDPLNWFYPPPALLAVIPISYLPFETGFFIWTIGLAVAAIALLKLASLRWLAIIAAMLSPATLWNLELGQFGALIGAALCCGLLLLDTAPWGAAMAFSLLVLKPQAGLLVPIVLLSRRSWRGIAGCAIAMSAILALTIIAAGWQVWHAYLAQGLAVSRSVLNAPPASANYEEFGISVFWMLRSFGAGLAVAYAGQAAAAIAAIVLTGLIWFQNEADRVKRMALTVFLSLLATPYGYTDDMVAWSIALAALAQARGWRIGLLDALFWLWPALCPVVFMQTGLLLTPIVVLAAVLRTLPLWPRRAAVLPGTG